jgi:hypothetical protein
MSSRRRKPLYPNAWGSGTKPFEATYKVFSVGSCGRDDLEAGDKVILPEAAFREVSRLRLEFPLMMHVKSVKKAGPRSQAKKYNQFCGVLEFSAPAGVAHMPLWMIKSLGLREGGRVAFKSVKNLPKGELAKFQPHQKEFIDFAAALGVRNVLELAMQHYSALSVGQTIIIQYGRDKYELDVVELQPRKSISLYGTVDLKVEFAPWDGPRILDLPPAEDEESIGENNPVLKPRQPNSRKPSSTRRPVRKNSREERRSNSNNIKNSNSRTTPTKNRKASNNTSNPKKSSRTPVGSRTNSSRPREGANGMNSKVRPKNGSMANNSSRKPLNETTSRTNSRSNNNNAKENKAWEQGNNNNTLKKSESSNTLNRKNKLAKFKKRNLAGLKTAGNDNGSTATATNEKMASSTPPAPVLKKNTMTSVDPPTSSSTNTSTSNNDTSTEKEQPKMAFAGTGNVLSSGAKVVSTPKPIVAATTNSTSSSSSSNNNNNNDVKDDEEKGETEAFAGKGKVLGGTVSKPAASVPWADLHRQRHQRHMERKKKEQAQKEKEEAEKRQKEQAHFAKIKETLQAEARERELAAAEKKALLDAQRAELESKVEDKLIRDQLIKKKREERIAKKKQLAQEKKDAELAKQLQEEMEGGRAKSPVAVGSAARAVRKSKKTAPKRFK